MKLVSIVIPAMNEESTLGLVLADVFATIKDMHAYEFEVLCVDDHSTDNTRKVAESFGARVIQNTDKPGKGMALRTGFAAASGEVIAMMDADYSHRPEDLPIFLEALKDGIGLVIGSRVVGGSEEYTHIRALGNVFLSTCLGLATRRYLSDALNGYKVFRREIFTDFQYTSTAFEIEIEIIANTMRKGYRIVEVSSHERSRSGGVAKSKVIQHGTRFLARIIYEGLKGVVPLEASQASKLAEIEQPVNIGVSEN
jgi:glycosyltransferase involved in cell wall biosynthesis